MSTAVLALIEAIIALEPAAQQLWQQLQPILAAGREPSADEWASLNALADAAHRAVQASAGTQGT